MASTTAHNCDPEGIVDHYHGMPVSDPYRWLEDGQSQQTREWLKAHAGRWHDYLTPLSFRNRIKARIAEMLSIDTAEPPIKAGNFYFYLKRFAHQQQACVWMRSCNDGQEEVLIDPSRWGPQTSVSILDVSESGTRLAYGVRYGGQDTQSVEVLNIPSRKALEWRLPKGFVRGIRLSETGVYYSHEDPESDRPHLRTVCYQGLDFGGSPPECLFVAGESRDLRLIPHFTRDLQYGYFLVLRATQPIRYSLVRQQLHSDIHYSQSIVADLPHRLDIRLSDGILFLCTDWGAPNGRVMQMRLDESNLEAGHEVVPECESRIEQWGVVGNRLYVNYVEELRHRTDVFDLDGRRLGQVPYEEKGSSRLAWPGWTSDELFCTFQSYSTPPRVYQLQGVDPLKLFHHNDIPNLPKGVRARQCMATSFDGTTIPVTVLGLPETFSRTPVPMVLTGYGASRASLTPRFSQLATSLIERGALFAIANLRGGGEFGAGWHKSAQGHARQTTFNDFYAVAACLIGEGLTRSDKLGIAGGSNGGLLVAVAMTQRPDLFRCALCLAPITDMLRYHRQNSLFHTEDYGCSDNDADFQALYTYSPYHNVRKGESYPALLMISGDSDQRCDPLHARKFVARIEAATASTYPILLDYSDARGHMAVLPLQVRIDALANRLAFLCDQLKIEA
jgi:prolyl oligopeptidase